MNSTACLPQLALPASGRAGFPLQPGHKGEVAFGRAVLKSGSCSEGNVGVTGPSQPAQHWGLSTRHSQVTASFDQEGSEVFGLLNL